MGWAIINLCCASHMNVCDLETMQSSQAATCIRGPIESSLWVFCEKGVSGQDWLYYDMMLRDRIHFVTSSLQASLIAGGENVQ